MCSSIDVETKVKIPMMVCRFYTFNIYLLKECVGGKEAPPTKLDKLRGNHIGLNRKISN